MKTNYELYGYAIETWSYSNYTGERIFIDRYHNKVYKTEDIAKRAIEENPYYKSESGFMGDYEIIPLYK